MNKLDLELLKDESLWEVKVVNNYVTNYHHKQLDIRDSTTTSTYKKDGLKNIIERWVENYYIIEKCRENYSKEDGIEYDYHMIRGEKWHIAIKDDFHIAYGLSKEDALARLQEKISKFNSN